MLLGAVVGYKIKNLPAAIVLALLCHYFLDLFPHIEYLSDGVEHSIGKLKQSHWQKNAKNMVKVFMDFCLGLLLIFLFSNPPYAAGVFRRPMIYLCAFIAIIPDGLTVLHSLFPNLGLALHHKIHSEKIHYLTKQKKFHIFWKIFTQVAAVIICIALLKS